MSHTRKNLAYKC